MKVLFKKIILTFVSFIFLFKPTLGNEDSLFIENQVGKIFQDSYYSDFNNSILALDSLQEFSVGKEMWEEFLVLQIIKISCASYHKNLAYMYNGLQQYKQDYEELKSRIDTINGGINEYYYDLGYYNYMLGDFRDAIDNYLKIVESINAKEKLNNAELSLLESTYRDIGSIHSRIGNHKEGIAYLEKSLIVSEKYRKDFPSRSKYELAYKQLGKIHQSLGNTEKAEEFYLLSYRGHLDKYLSRKDSRRYKNRLITSANSLATFYSSQNEFSKAYEFFTVSISYHLENDPMLMDSYKLFGDYFAKIEQLDSAAFYHQKSLKLKKTTYSPNSYQIAESHEALGDLAKQKENWSKALEYYQLAMGNLVLNFEENDPTLNPEIQREQIISTKQLLRILKSKSQVQYKLYAEKQEIQQLENAWASLQKSLDLLDVMQLDFQVSEDKYLLEADISSTVEQGIAIAKALHEEKGDISYLNQAFQIAERSKAFLLLDALRASQAREFAGIPTDLVEREHQLKYELLYWEDQWKKALADTEGSKKQSKAQEKIFELRESFRELQAELKQFPQYYQATLGQETVDAGRVQDLLDRDQALIEYFVGKEKSYVFLITKNQVFLHELDEGQHLEQKKDELYVQLKRPIDDKAYKFQDKAAFAESAHQLYLHLFKPLEELTALPERLIIVPDLFSNISFDALLSQAAKDKEFWGDETYLFHQYHISYSYSASLLDLMMHQAQNPAFDRFLMVSNTFSESPVQSVSLGERYDALNYIPQVMTTIRHHFSADSLLEAKKLDFLQRAKDYKWLHLATHGVLNGSQPNDSYLVFAKEDREYGKLFLRELYASKLNAAMVVLGACNSGYGYMKSGEGMISLARGFSYAGVSSIVATLWSVNEISTTRLISNYYEELALGLPKDVALGNAKRKYFSEHTGAEYLHPAYWSPMILIGDTSPLHEPLSIWAYIGLFLLLFGLMYWVYRRKMT